MRRFWILSLILLIAFVGRKALVGIFSNNTNNEPEPKVVSSTEEKEDVPVPEPEKPEEKELEDMLDFALSLEGSPYRGGGTTPEGFDCSGFVRYVYRDVDVVLPRSSSAMALAGESIDLEDSREGDLLFFTGSDASSGEIGHVALVISHSSDELNMIHASNRGVVIDNYYEMPYYQQRYISACRPKDW